jgi:hypothetical protein
MRRGYLALTLASAAAVTLSSALPADASSVPSWRLFYHHHYTPGNSAYFSITAASSRSAWAVGSADFAGPIGGVPVAARWHNGRWTATAMPKHLTSILWAVSADSSTDAWTVSNQGGYALHWHGGRWTVARRWSESGGLPRELTGVTAFSPTNVWVFGGSGAFPGIGTWHEHSGVWTKVSGVGGNISFASALSPSDMWAVGGINVGEDSIVHYAGGRWHHITSPALRGLQFNAILALSPGNVWTAASKGGPGTARLLQLRRGRWTRRALPAGFDPTHITADGHGGLWFTALNRANAVWLLHRSATGRWAIVRDPGALALALIPGTRSLWGAGAVSQKSGFEAAIYAHGKVG